MRKWVIAIPTVVVAIGASLVYYGLITPTFFPGGILIAIYGAIILIAGIIFLLVAIAYGREEIKNPISRRVKTNA